MSEKILLIDGHSILNRAYYGVPPLTNSKGEPTGGVYGFMNIMYKIIEQENPQYMAVAFDRHEPTFRHKRFAEYKGTRKPMPDDLKAQVPVLKELLRASGIRVLEFPGYEADDIIGTISRYGAEGGFETIIVSGDRDLLQLVNDKVTQFIPKTKSGVTTTEVYTPAKMLETYGVTPHEFIDVKALQGDASDNIPGVPGIGEKTAQTLISTYHSLEGIMEHIDEVKPPRAKTALSEHYDMAELSRELATINTNVPLDGIEGFDSTDGIDSGDFQALKITSLYTPEAYEIIGRLELKKLMKKFTDSGLSVDGATPSSTFVKANEAGENPFENAQEKSEKAELVEEKPHTKAPSTKRSFALPSADVTSFSGMDLGEIDQAFETYKEGSDICLIYEELFGERHVAISFDGKKVYDIKLAWMVDETYIKEKMDALAEKLATSLSAQTAGQAGAQLDRAITQTMHEANSAPRIITLNLQSILRDFELATSPAYYDASIAAYLLNPLNSTYNYEDIARDYLDIPTLPAKAQIFDKKNMPAEDAKEVIDYISNITIVPYLAREVLDERLELTGMAGLFENLEMPTAFALHNMEKEGIRVNREELKAYGEKLKTEIDRLETEIHELAGEEFNINSPKQLGEILFNKLGLPGAKKTKSGYSTAADVLEKLRPHSPIVAKVLEYRTYAKLKSTYADGLDGYICEDGRIHGHFQQTITATGRISSTEPNLQNIPVREELGREIRKVFIPKDGCVFVDADYSQIELRVLAHLSQDDRLTIAYNSAEDIHKITASEVFGTPLEEVTSAQRRAAKAVNFGIVYGESAFGLSEGLGISRKEANSYIEQYFETYPGVKAFLDRQVLDAKNNGYVTTFFGRRRPVPELKASNFMQRQFGERVAMNSPIQGTAADIMKMAMLAVTKALEDGGYKSRVVLQVHDELLLEVPFDEQEAVTALLKEKMRSVAEFRVPLEVSTDSGKSWFETK